MTTTAAAFKEWAVIVEALGAGAQTLILRKGGIAEGKDGFNVAHTHFWLFPTQYHQQMEKTKSEAAQFASTSTPSDKIPLKFWAEVTDSVFIEDEQLIPKLNPFHLWREETIRERFHYKKPGLFLLMTRIFHAQDPAEITITPEIEGCKSWIETAAVLPLKLSTPILKEDDFQSQRKQILNSIQT